MRKFLFVFALSLMTLGTSAQIQEGAKLDNRTATLDKGKGTDDQELTTGKVDLEAKNDLKKDSEKITDQNLTDYKVTKHQTGKIEL